MFSPTWVGVQQNWFNFQYAKISWSLNVQRNALENYSINQSALIISQKGGKKKRNSVCKRKQYSQYFV